MDWEEQAERARERYRGGETREHDQRQLTQLGNAAWGAGLCLRMAGRGEESAEWLRTAAERYRESWRDAPPDSWGRPIAAMKALLLAGDDAAGTARRTLEAGAAEAESPIGRYAGTLALLVLGRDVEARNLGSTLRARDDFPAPVADALVEVAARARTEYAIAIENVLASFEARGDFLEDARVADTVLVLQLLAARRDIAVKLPKSDLLPL